MKKHRWRVTIAVGARVYFDLDTAEIVIKEDDRNTPAQIRVTAEQFEVSPSGALAFYGDRKSTWEMVLLFAAGQWTSVIPDHLEE